MSSERDKESENAKAKRWRPRFSLRTLVILVTLVCCYAACWGPTKRQGVVDVLRHVRDLYALGHPRDDLVIDFHRRTSATMPFVVGIELGSERHYYFWFFGYVAELPYGHKLPPPRRITVWE